MHDSIPMIPAVCMCYVVYHQTPEISINSVSPGLPHLAFYLGVSTDNRLIILKLRTKIRAGSRTGSDNDHQIGRLEKEDDDAEEGRGSDPRGR